MSIVFIYTQLNVKTVLFQEIQFRLSTQFSSIWPLDMTLSGATTPGQSGPGSNGNERHSVFSKASALLEPHHQIFKCYILYTRWGGSYHSTEK